MQGHSDLRRMGMGAVATPPGIRGRLYSSKGVISRIVMYRIENVTPTNFSQIRRFTG